MDSEASSQAAEAFGRLYGIIARLRAPDGCPWDKEQTPKSLRSSVVEEAYELVEAIDEGDAAHVCEEAGDLYLLATMIPFIYEESGDFSVADSLNGLCDKLIRRHPNVFGDASALAAAAAKAGTPEAVVKQWNEIKEKVEGRRKKDSLLDEVSRALPPLERAYKIQKKAAKAGFDWGSSADVWAKAREELAEAEEACNACGQAASSGDRAALEEELGDLLYSTVNLARFLKVDPALALASTNEKFCRRFRHIEKRMAESGQELCAANMEMMDGFWEEAKIEEKK
jgi:tetrapyrrole methylase family protein/MazG family protein